MKDADSPSPVPEPLAHFLAKELARAIELGSYKPGQRLVESDIAERYGVSRAPVREALRMLTRDELVVQRPRRGTVVVDLSPEEISEMFELRSALYAAVVRTFTRRATEAELEEFAALHRRITELSKDPALTAADFVEATQASSVFVVDRCGNERLQRTFRKLTSQSYRHYAMLAHTTIENRQRLAVTGNEMVAAALARDAEAASMFAWRLHEANHAAARAALKGHAKPRAP